jgi:hypothetical protein
MTLLLDNSTIIAVEKYLRELKATPPGTWDYPLITPAMFLHLGCPYTTLIDEDDPSQGDAYNAALINDTVCRTAHATIPSMLVEIVRWLPQGVAPLHVLLSGLYRTSAWRCCLRDENIALALAVALLRTIDVVDREEDGMDELLDRTKRDCLEFASEWIAPATPWSELPTPIEVAQRLFGPMWCAMALPDVVSASMSSCEVIAAVRLHRPPFLPGLCPAQDVILSAPLPDDVGYFT